MRKYNEYIKVGVTNEILLTIGINYNLTREEALSMAASNDANDLLINIHPDIIIAASTSVIASMMKPLRFSIFTRWDDDVWDDEVW